MHKKALVLTTILGGLAWADYTEAPVVNGGTITGKVTWDGTPPKTEPLKVTQDPSTCGAMRDQTSVIVAPDGAVENVVVYLTDATSGKKANFNAKPELDQKICHYTPGVQVIGMNTVLQVKNSDPILHNVHAYVGQGGATLLNLAMPKQGMVIAKKIKKAGGMTLKCDVHNFMRGAFFVAENPYYAVTGPDGSYTISDVPPGSYHIATFHEVASPKTAPITVAPNGTATFSPKIK